MNNCSKNRQNTGSSEMTSMWTSSPIFLRGNCGLSSRGSRFRGSSTPYHVSVI